MQQSGPPKSAKQVRLERVSRARDSAPVSPEPDARCDVPLLPSNLKTVDCRGMMAHPTIPFPRSQEQPPTPVDETSKTQKRQPVSQDTRHHESAPVPPSESPAKPALLPVRVPPKENPKSTRPPKTSERVADEATDALFLQNMRSEYLKTAAEKEQLIHRLSESREREAALTSHKEKMKAVAASAGERVAELERENRELQNKVTRLELMLAQMADEAVQTQLRSANDHFLVAENEHLRRDNQKLFALLKETNEYQKLASFAGPENAVRLIHSPPSPPDSPPRQKGPKEVPTDLLWAPEKAFQFLRALNHCEGFRLPEASVNLIVYELNRIWRRRELYILEKCHAFCKNCKNKLLWGPNHPPSRTATGGAAGQPRPAKPPKDRKNRESRGAPAL